jgi:hypothetical protein
VRPASPYVTEVLAGYFGSAIDVPIRRSLSPDYRKLTVGVSALPLVPPAASPTISTITRIFAPNNW